MEFSLLCWPHTTGLFSLDSVLPRIRGKLWDLDEYRCSVQIDAGTVTGLQIQAEARKTAELDIYGLKSG